MAYLREIERCRGCSTRVAVCRLINRYNSDLGAYCRGCGKRALKRQQAAETEVVEEKGKPCTSF